MVIKKNCTSCTWRPCSWWDTKWIFVGNVARAAPRIIPSRYSLRSAKLLIRLALIFSRLCLNSCSFHGARYYFLLHQLERDIISRLGGKLIPHWQTCSFDQTTAGERKSIPPPIARCIWQIPFSHWGRDCTAPPLMQLIKLFAICSAHRSSLHTVQVLCKNFPCSLIGMEFEGKKRPRWIVFGADKVNFISWVLHQQSSGVLLHFTQHNGRQAKTIIYSGGTAKFPAIYNVWIGADLCQSREKLTEANKRTPVAELSCAPNI